MVLNRVDVLIISTHSTKMTIKDSVEFIEKKGFQISESTYKRRLKKISKESRDRAYEIAKEFLEYHINTVDELHGIKEQMFELANNETDNLKKATILTKLTEVVIPYLASAREDTKDIIEESVRRHGNTQEEDTVS